MATSSQTVKPATTARLLHASFMTGIVLFALVVYFLTRPQQADEHVPPVVRNTLLGISLIASALSLFVMRGRVPRRSSAESADLYWTTALPLALQAWMPAELGGLAGVVLYMLDGALAGLAVAAIAIAAFIALHPGRLERV